MRRTGRKGLWRRTRALVLGGALAGSVLGQVGVCGDFDSILKQKHEIEEWIQLAHRVDECAGLSENERILKASSFLRHGLESQEEASLQKDQLFYAVAHNELAVLFLRRGVREKDKQEAFASEARDQAQKALTLSEDLHLDGQELRDYRSFAGVFRANLARADYLRGEIFQALVEFSASIDEGVGVSSITDDLYFLARKLAADPPPTKLIALARIFDDLALKIADSAGTDEAKKFVLELLSSSQYEDSKKRLSSTLIQLYANDFPGLTNFRQSDCRKLAKYASNSGLILDLLRATQTNASCLEQPWHDGFRAVEAAVSLKTRSDIDFARDVRRRFAQLLLAVGERGDADHFAPGIQARLYKSAFEMDPSLIDALPFLMDPPETDNKRFVLKQLAHGPPIYVSASQFSMIKDLLGVRPRRIRREKRGESLAEARQGFVVEVPETADRVESIVSSPCPFGTEGGVYQRVNQFVTPDKGPSLVAVQLDRPLTWGESTEVRVFDIQGLEVMHKRGEVRSADFVWGRFRWYGRVGGYVQQDSRQLSSAATSLTGGLTADFAIKTITGPADEGCSKRGRDSRTWGFNWYAESRLEAYPVTAASGNSLVNRWGPVNETGVYVPWLLPWRWTSRGSRIGTYVAPLWKGGYQGGWLQPNAFKPVAGPPFQYSAFGLRAGYLRYFDRLSGAATNRTHNYRDQPSQALLSHIDLLVGIWNSLDGPSVGNSPTRRYTFEARGFFSVPHLPVAYQISLIHGPGISDFRQAIVMRFEFSKYFQRLYQGNRSPFQAISDR